MALACRNGAFLLLGLLPLEQAFTTSIADQRLRKQVRLLCLLGRKGETRRWLRCAVQASSWCCGHSGVALSICFSFRLHPPPLMLQQGLINKSSPAGFVACFLSEAEAHCDVFGYILKGQGRFLAPSTHSLSDCDNCGQEPENKPGMAHASVLFLRPVCWRCREVCAGERCAAGPQ